MEPVHPSRASDISATPSPLPEQRGEGQTDARANLGAESLSGIKLSEICTWLSSPSASKDSPTPNFTEQYTRIQHQFLHIAEEILEKVKKGMELDENTIQSLRVAADISELMRTHLRQATDIQAELSQAEGEQAILLARQRAELHAQVQSKEIEIQKAMQTIKNEQETHQQKLKAAEQEQKLKAEQLHFQRDQDLIKMVFDLRKNLNEDSKAQANALDKQHDFIFQAAAANNERLLKSFIALGLSLELTNAEGFTAISRAVKEGNSQAAQLLKNNGANLKAKDRKGRTLLHLAVKSGNIPLVQLVNDWTKKKLIEKKDANGATPLWLAIKESKLEVAKWLKQQGARIQVENTKGETLCHLAASTKSFPLVEWLLSLNPLFPQSTDNKGRTALQAAVANGSLDIAKLLVAHKADTKIKTNNESTLLHLAVTSGHEEMTSWLIDQGLDLEAKQSLTYYTPLGCAAREGHIHLAKLLIKRGAKIDAKDFHEGSLLHLAAGARQADMLSWLLSSNLGLDVGWSSEMMGTPLEWAVGCGSLKSAILLFNAGASLEAKSLSCGNLLHIAIDSNIETVEWILSRLGLNGLIAVNEEGNTPFHTAVLKGKLDMAKLLLEREMSISAAVNQKKETVLHIAVQSKSLQMVEWVVEHFPNCFALINAINGEEITPLQKATLMGLLEIAKYLVAKKAFSHIKTKEQKTLLHLAEEQGHEHFINWLLDLGQELESKAKDSSSKPLDLAVQNGKVEAAKVLIMRGASIKAHDSNTLLHRAVYSGSEEMLNWLLSPQFKLDIEEIGYKYTPLQNAVSFLNTRAADILLSHGANLKVKDREGNSLLHLAIATGNLKVVQWAHQHSGKEANNKGNSPLHCAVLKGCLEIAKFLVAEGASTKAGNHAKETLLHLAVKSKSLEMVIWVYGLIPNKLEALDENNNTPEKVAKELKFEECQSFLRSKRVKKN